ncbi:hypothetical protein FCV25MIE_08229 [Fagus crenata]
MSVEIGSGTGVGAVLRRGTGDEDAGVAVVDDERSIGPVGKVRESRLETSVSMGLVSGERRSMIGAETVPVGVGQRPVEICVSVDLLRGEMRSVAGAETLSVVLGQKPVDN